VYSNSKGQFTHTLRCTASLVAVFHFFKLATLAYKALHTGQPPHLSELLQHYEPTRTLRSSSFFQLSVPTYNLEFGSRAFRISVPKIWNLLPASMRDSPSLPTFRRHLKTHYFQSAYHNPLMTTHSQRALILYRRRRFINHLLTYLLTFRQYKNSSEFTSAAYV